MQRRSRFWSVGAALAILFAALPARSETKTVVRMLPEEISADAGAGIPFQLTRPVFRLTEKLATPQTGMTTYVLSLGYEADPHQRYSLLIDTGRFSESDLTVKLGSIGNLTQMNSSARDQLVPTLVAIGEFAASAVTLAATASAGVPVLLPVGATDAPAGGEVTVQSFAGNPDNLMRDLAYRIGTWESAGLEESQHEMSTEPAPTPCDLGPVSNQDTFETPLERLIWRVEEGREIIATKERRYRDFLDYVSGGASHKDILFRKPVGAECQVWQRLKSRVQTTTTENAFREGFYDRDLVERDWLRTARERSRCAGIRPDEKGTPLADCHGGWLAYLTQAAIFQRQLENERGNTPSDWRSRLEAVEGQYLNLACSMPPRLQPNDSAVSTLRDRCPERLELKAFADADQESGKLLNQYVAALQADLAVAGAPITARELHRRQETLAQERKSLAHLLVLASLVCDDERGCINSLKAAASTQRVLPGVAGAVGRAVAAGDAQMITGLKKLIEQVSGLKPHRDGALAVIEAALPVAHAEHDERLITMILDLPANEWRRRHVLFLEASMAEIERRLNQRPSPDERQALRGVRTVLRTEWLQTVGVAELDGESERLRLAIDSILQAEILAPAAQRPDVPGLADLEIARVARQAVEAEIIAVRTKLKKPISTPPPERTIDPMLLVYRGPGQSTPEYVKQCVTRESGLCRHSSWTLDKPGPRPDKQPEFVVVIEKGGR